MTKIIRKTYPRDFSTGVIVIIFALVFFLAGQLFDSHQSQEEGFICQYLDDFLVSVAVIIMVLILWEEILFPVTIRPEDGGLLFRNHKRKLIIQGLIYLWIPTIVVFLFLTYNVNEFRFFIWAGVVIILPIIGKLTSGINNYNDYLKLTPDLIEYKDNDLEGSFRLQELHQLCIHKDEHGDLHQLELKLHSSGSIFIQIHQMELEDFYEAIEEYIQKQYASLVSDNK